MFFSRKKRAAQQAAVDAALAELAAELTRSAEEANQQLSAAEKISEAGERYLALTAAEKKVQTLAKEGEDKVAGRADALLVRPKQAVYKCSGLSMFAGGLAVVATTICIAPVATVLSLAACAGGMLTAAAGLAVEGISPKGGEDVEKFIRVKDDFCKSLNDLSQKIAMQKTAIVDNELAALAASPHYNNLYDNFPQVTHAFTRAAARDNVNPPVVRLDKPSYPRRQG